jgi:hypothetical protein
MLQQFICITILLFKTGVGTAASSSNSTHRHVGPAEAAPHRSRTSRSAPSTEAQIRRRPLLNSEERKGFVIEVVPFASDGLHVI